MAVVGVPGALLTAMQYWLGAAARGWLLVGSVVTLLASPGPAGIGPALVWFTDLGPVLILGAVVRPVRRPSGPSLRAVRDRGRPS